VLTNDQDADINAYLEFTVYSNPIDHTLFLSPGKLDLVKSRKVYNSLGVECLFLPALYSSIENLIELDVSKLCAGLYFLQVNLNTNKL